MEAELGNNTIDGSFADSEVTLSEFLSNNLGAGLRIQESVADDLANQFLGAAVVGFGPSLGAEESLGAALEEQGSELEVTLAAKTEFRSRAIDAIGPAFAFDEHGELTSDFVIFGNGQGSGLALNTLGEKLESNHGISLAERHK